MEGYCEGDVVIPAQGDGEDPVIYAMGHLDPDNPDHWNRDNKPQVGALEDILGFHISVGERDRAWARYRVVQTRPGEPGGH